MNKYDKNSLIGLLLIAAILITFQEFFLPPISQPEESINKTEKTNDFDKSDTYEKTQIDTSANISKEILLQYGIFANSSIGKEELKVLENDKIKATVSTKGGRINSVIIKKGPNGKEYITYDGKELEIFNSDSSLFNLKFLTNKEINTKDLYFKSNLKNNSLSMKLHVNEEQYIEYLYTISEDYLIDLDINLIGMENIIASNVNYMNLEWQMKTPQTEKSKENQDMYTGIQYQYNSDQEVDYLSFTSKKDDDQITSKLNWVAFKQQFFSSIIIAKNGFNKPTTLVSLKNENSKYIKDLYAKFELPYTHKNKEQINLQFYFGPNHYKTLKSFDKNFEELVPLGWGIFGWVNQYIVINIFDFLSRFISNYGIIILLLTIIIKLALAPFTYKAYLSQAKMKVLKPEIDKINEKFKGKDPLKIQQETMKIYRKAGVNPMGGCLPMLFQFPILIAMFRFFPASIELRQESFLWADDLSTFDSILDLPFNIPFYGEHVSLFTLLMTISTLLYTRMNASMATGQMAQMKWIMYLMPIMFLGFFNNYAAALSYYYFLANMFTFTQQYFMKKLIDEKAILKQIEYNKKNPKKKSKFQKKLEEMQRKQEEKMRKRK